MWVDMEVSKVDSVTFLIETLHFWVVHGLVWLEELRPEGHVFERDWIACSQYDNYSRLNSQHNCRRGLYDRFVNTWISTWAPKLWGKWLWPRFGFGTLLCTNHVVYIPGEVVRKSNHLRPTCLIMESMHIIRLKWCMFKCLQERYGDHFKLHDMLNLLWNSCNPSSSLSQII